MDYALTDVEHNWRIMVGMPVIFALVQFLIIFIAPRSPYFLISKQLDEEAKETLRKLSVALAVFFCLFVVRWILSLESGSFSVSASLTLTLSLSLSF